ncbi:MAG: TraR/DksA family transcriptional regulator [Candidatus Brocadiales bacterium]
MQRKMSLRQLKNQLSTRRSHLIHEIEQRLQESRDFGGHRFADVADMASNTSCGELLWLVVEEEKRQLAQIDEALARIKSGSYGICKYCGRPIKKARLEALPFVILCVKCKEVEEEEAELESRAEEVEAPLLGKSLGKMGNDEVEVKSRRVKKMAKDIEPIDSYSRN